MTQPYIYTLPEQFIADKSVPMRWKLYALINGFWIGGKTVFASNKFFADKLGCTERHIQNCLEELEKGGVLERIGVSQNRKIVPRGTNSGFVGGRTGGSRGDEPSVHHTSVSISDNLTIGADAQIIEEVSEDQPRKKSQSKFPNARSLFKEVFGPKYPASWNTNPAQLQAGENLFLEHGIEEARDLYGWYQKHKPRDFAWEILTPWDLDTKWPKLDAYFDKITT